ncbi:KilA-N domain-containing protein [Metapseudomonas otitidis]|uniref:KilA-N domain-containing protein n=1 Tax=Metapseudomonas otitidis TaxID=319939 RepID=UPI002810D834|nr:KilA-N domain-containing protein [Pseudomonas otitidis]WMR35365.1 KilA-N domain-containing protein [Pseudomonas otitidis]
MKNVIPFHYQGQAIRFNCDGWINATAAATLFGQEPRDWLRLHETECYMRALAKHLGIPFEPKMVERKQSKKVQGGKSGFRPELSNCAGLVVTRRGAAANGGGTWLHPKLAVAFARWLNVDFAVWCDLHIDALLRGELNEKQQFERACQEYDEAFLRASRGAKEMARFRWRKPLLVEQVEHWRHQLQLTLGLDDQAA